MRPLLIVDGDNLSHRAYHTTPKSVAQNAVVGFLNMLGRVWQEEKPRAIFVAWDTLGVKTYRDDLWPAYQGGRVFDQSIRDQLEMLPDVCRSFQFGVGKQAGYEADDLMATAARLEIERGGSALIYTTDRDAYQLVSDRVTVIAPRPRVRELERVSPDQVVARFGVLPEQVPDFKALSGDSSDKIPGIKGIGPKTAADLLLRHGCLEEIVGNWPEEQARLALLFKQVTQMRDDADVCLPEAPPDWTAGASRLRQLGVQGLADRLEMLTSV